MRRTQYLGIDPGKSGAIALLSEDGSYVDTIRLRETHHDIAEWLASAAETVRFAVIERVGAMPKQGVSSTFKFGTSYGFVQGLVVANRIPYELVTPSKWQGAMGCLSRGDKNVTKAAAQRLFPVQRVVHATADALLLARYARRIYNQRAGTPAL